MDFESVNTRHEDKQKERIQELEAKVKGLEEKSDQAEKRSALVEEEVNKEKEKSKRLEEAVICAVCFDILWRAQSLECGHTACYACLKNWWNRYHDEGTTITSAMQEGGYISTPNQFQSVVNRKKECPQCKRHITRRPSPNYVVSDIVEIINNYLRPIPSYTQLRKDQLFPPGHDDPWDGIFHPEHLTGSSRSIVHPITEEDRIAILHEMATRRTRRAVGEALARRQGELDEARQYSQRMAHALQLHESWRGIHHRQTES